MVETPREEDAPPEGVRLQKLLAAAGVDSRRKSEEYVVTGRVTVDGEVVTDPGRKVDLETQDVRLDGERLRPQRKRYYLLNKPPGYLCTNYDPAGRARAVDLVPAQGARLFTVGRLDESSQGLLLVTNDGELAERLAHPRYQVPRVYRVQVAGVPTPETLAQLRKGVHFAEGRFGVKRTKRLKTHGKSAFVEVELTQGQNREIRRLFARFGHKVIWLQRVAFGPLKLGDLPVGKFRALHGQEIKALQEFVRAGARKSPPRRVSGTKAPQKASAPKSAGGRLVLDLIGGGPKKPAKAGTAKGGSKPARGGRSGEGGTSNVERRRSKTARKGSAAKNRTRK